MGGYLQCRGDWKGRYPHKFEVGDVIEREAKYELIKKGLKEDFCCLK